MLNVGNNVLIASPLEGDKKEISLTVNEKILLHGPGLDSGLTLIFQKYFSPGESPFADTGY